jgi:hypothetical protein
MNEVLLERALRDLSRIEDDAARAGGDLSVLACLVDMAADEAREQLAILKQEAAAGKESRALLPYPLSEALQLPKGR